MSSPQYTPPEAPRLPTRDRALPSGCVFWMCVIGFVLTCLALFGSRALTMIAPEGLDWSWKDLISVSQESVVQTFQTVTIAGKSYRLEVMTTDAQREQGLSDRPSLPPGTGMRFIFERPDRYTFWMNKMRFSIDMIFLNDGTIVNIANNVPYPKTPTEEPATIRPQQAFTEVLELPAGDADRLGLKIGQRIVLP